MTISVLTKIIDLCSSGKFIQINKVVETYNYVKSYQEETDTM